MKHYLIFIFLIVVIISTCACGDEIGLSTISSNEQYLVDGEEGIAETTEIKTESQTIICAYVCGAVNNEGVYYFEIGAIKEEALTAAGGFIDGSARTYVNLAEAITDGEKIYFPFEDELQSDMAMDSNLYNEQGTRLININIATKEELMSLTGIGESKAVAIIDYRETLGAYKSIEEIMNIEGIKEGVFNKIKDEITVN